MQDTKITIKNLKKSFTVQNNITQVLNDISFTFHKNKSYAITGVSGTGKSTLLHILSCLEPPTEGGVFLSDKNIFNFSEEEKNRFLNKTIGLVFQEPHLIYELTVLENVMIKGLICNDNYEACKKKAMNLLEKTGLTEKMFSNPATLSGGQKQRVAVARALYSSPDFLLADEPTGNLDQETGKSVVDFLIDCKNEWGMGIIITTHNHDVASVMEEVLKLENGKFIQMQK